MTVEHKTVFPARTPYSHTDFRLPCVHREMSLIGATVTRRWLVFSACCEIIQRRVTCVEPGENLLLFADENEDVIRDSQTAQGGDVNARSLLVPSWLILVRRLQRTLIWEGELRSVVRTVARSAVRGPCTLQLDFSNVCDCILR